MKGLLLRLGVPALLAAGLTCPSVASASHPACNLLRDPAGDTATAVPDETDELDLVGGDIANNRRQLTVVIRLAALTEEDVTEPAGRIWEFDFTANNKNFILMAALLPGGSEFEAYVSGQRFEKGKGGTRAATGIGALHGTIDVRHKQVRMTGPVSIFKNAGASLSQTYFDHLVMFSYRAHGESLKSLPTGDTVDVSTSFGVSVDDAWSSKRYVPGHPSCVVVGT